MHGKYYDYKQMHFLHFQIVTSFEINTDKHKCLQHLNTKLGTYFET
jgi:hypothetical protein